MLGMSESPFRRNSVADPVRMMRSPSQPSYYRVAMQQTTAYPTAAWINRVAALITSGETGPTAVARFLPSPSDPDYSDVLCRLVRTDLRSRVHADRSSAYAEYRAIYPVLPVEVPPDFDESAVTDLSRTPLPPVMSMTQATRVRPMDVVDADGPPMVYPKLGESFGEFHLVDELGRGAFGRVFLATEKKLADRLVALKVTRKQTNESQRLARLQHTNIVPIHNAMSINGWHVVQMPFFGRQTLADLLDTVKADKTFPKVSGDVFASTQMRATTSRKTLSSPLDTPSTPPESDRIRVSPEILASSGERQPSRELLVGLSYIDAAVWLMNRLADGLAHAHSKEILHLDLKPHNILLSDDGQPMLLDFNLSFDRKKMDRDRVGGTWPYMAPEQICEYARRPGSPVDERSDLYSLGVMFFELLTTRQPFEPVQTNDAGLTMAIEARLAGAPDVRDFNPHVPPSIAAVVAKLLAPSPLHRYQSADELREDLRRHNENRPLAFARDRNVKERVTKWHRRHPRASLLTCVAVLLLGLFFTAAQMMAWSQDRQRHAAVDQATTFRAEHSRLRLDLTSLLDPETRNKAITTANNWLKTYHVGQPEWTDEPNLRLLSDSERSTVRKALGETALLAAHGHWLNSRNAAPDTKEEQLQSALAFNKLAAAGFDSVTAIVQRQRNDLHGLASPVDLTDGDAGEELYATAMRDIATGKYEDAARHLTKLTLKQPDHYAGQFALGICFENLGQTVRASERYQVAKPLGPQDARPAFHRGLLLFHQGRYAEAEADFSEALQRDDKAPAAYLQRGLARRQRLDLAGAIDDFSKEIVLEKGHAFIALAVRAQTYTMLKKTDKAAEDLKTLDSLTPKTDLDYVARATRWLAADPAKALADYQSALKLNPDCLSALMNTSHIYADVMLQPELALAVQEKAVKAHGGHNRVRAGHAVLLARTGKRTEAHNEADVALTLGSDPLVTYQAACVFALTAAEENKDRERAYSLLRQSLRDGYRRFDEIQIDADLKNIRDTDEFKRAIKAAMELVK
ncbi:hypothetical protein BH11PLA2_BH11PLA2_15950 [soil metagenome]